MSKKTTDEEKDQIVPAEPPPVVEEKLVDDPAMAPPGEVAAAPDPLDEELARANAEAAAEAEPPAGEAEGVAEAPPADDEKIKEIRVEPPEHHVMRNLKCALTDEERLLKFEQSSKLFRYLQAVKAEASATATRFRKKQVALTEQIEELNIIAEEGEEQRPVRCRREFDWKEGLVKFFREDTNEEVSQFTRKLTQDEREGRMFDDWKHIDKDDNPPKTAELDKHLEEADAALGKAMAEKVAKEADEKAKEPQQELPLAEPAEDTAAEQEADAREALAEEATEGPSIQEEEGFPDESTDSEG